MKKIKPTWVYHFNSFIIGKTGVAGLTSQRTSTIDVGAGLIGLIPFEYVDKSFKVYFQINFESLLAISTLGIHVFSDLNLTSNQKILNTVAFPEIQTNYIYHSIATPKLTNGTNNNFNNFLNWSHSNTFIVDYPQLSQLNLILNTNIITNSFASPGSNYNYLATIILELID